MSWRHSIFITSIREVTEEELRLWRIKAANQSDRSTVGHAPGTIGITFVENDAFSTYSARTKYKDRERDVLIEVPQIKADERAPAGAFPADDIVKTIGPRLKPAS
jgi:hypothetical protein